MKSPDISAFGRMTRQSSKKRALLAERHVNSYNIVVGAGQPVSTDNWSQK
jgi:hypothetical protein